MTDFHQRSVCTAMLTLLFMAQFAEPASAWIPTSTISGVKRAIIECEVTIDQLTANCGYKPSIYWKPGGSDLALIRDVNAHPEHLADATPGAKVEVMVRRAPEMQSDGATTPADWAPPAPSGAPPLIVDPNWRIRPPDHDLNPAYPERAFRMKISGDATATCSIGPRGDLVGCWLSSENPADQGFGYQLLLLSTFLKIDPLTRSGLPSPGRTIKIGAHYTVSQRGDFAIQLVVPTE